MFRAIDQIAAADDEETDEKAGKHGASPESSTEALHVEDCRDSACGDFGVSISLLWIQDSVVRLDWGTQPKILLPQHALGLKQRS